MITDERLREILAGAEGVTPGPWERRADPSHYDSVTDIYAQGFIIAQTCGTSFDGMEARAAHIARLDPQTITSILTELLSRREADEWQPIETCPEGVNVEMYWHDPLYPHRCHVEKQAYFGSAPMQAPKAGVGYTHWRRIRPLPQPPQGQKP